MNNRTVRRSSNMNKECMILIPIAAGMRFLTTKRIDRKIIMVLPERTVPILTAVRIKHMNQLVVYLINNDR